MKIAIIIRKLNIKGGAQRQALELASNLKKRGHEVVLYTFVYSKDDCYEKLLDSLKVVRLDDYKVSSNYFINLILENKLSKKLAFLIDKDTEVLNPHDQVSYKVAHYFKKKVKKISSVWMMNDMPTKTWSFWRDSQFDSSIKASLFKKFTYWLVDFYDYFKFIRHQDKIVVLDNRDKGWVKKYFKKDALVVRSGLDLKNITYRERQLLSSKVRILMSGIFFPHRRFEDGIMAIKNLKEKNKNIKLVIIGDYKNSSNYYKKLTDLVSNLGLNKVVKFVGKVSESEFKSFFEKSDIFVFPSHLQSWGLVVFEAMARGLPVIVSKTAGASEVLTNYENSIIVKPKSSDGIALAIEELIDNPDLYQKISRAGRRFVEKNISWDNYTKEMLKIFQLKTEQ